MMRLYSKHTHTDQGQEEKEERGKEEGRRWKEEETKGRRRRKEEGKEGALQRQRQKEHAPVKTKTGLVHRVSYYFLSHLIANDHGNKMRENSQ